MMMPTGLSHLFFLFPSKLLVLWLWGLTKAFNSSIIVQSHAISSSGDWSRDSMWIPSSCIPTGRTHRKRVNELGGSIRGRALEVRPSQPCQPCRLSGPCGSEPAKSPAKSAHFLSPRQVWRRLPPPAVDNRVMPFFLLQAIVTPSHLPLLPSTLGWSFPSILCLSF